MDCFSVQETVSITNEDSEARERVFAAMDDGAKIALLFGGSALTANNTIGSRQDSTVHFVQITKHPA